ncbi:MAG: type II toxin-antitoxin system VapC family toxin [Planctomycetes bacterium]|nr:type II toxin-antitoxin system VapC family toxin [Planctomycetota bacterium]
MTDNKDINHLKSVGFRNKLLISKTRLLTTNFVMDETFTLMLMDLGYKKTVEFKNNLDQLVYSNLLMYYTITQQTEEEAWHVFKSFNKDKTWSFTDCTSKVVMDSLGANEAFAFDRHFEQMGFTKLPF